MKRSSSYQSLVSALHLTKINDCSEILSKKRVSNTTTMIRYRIFYKLSFSAPRPQQTVAEQEDEWSGKWCCSEQPIPGLFIMSQSLSQNRILPKFSGTPFQVFNRILRVLSSPMQRKKENFKCRRFE